MIFTNKGKGESGYSGIKNDDNLGHSGQSGYSGYSGQISVSTYVADATSENIVTQYNTLMQSLKNANIISFYYDGPTSFEVVSVSLKSYEGEGELGDEIFNQSTFTPAYDKWNITGDFSFVDNTLVYTHGENWYGEAGQLKTDFLKPYTSGQQYKFEWVLQNVVHADSLHAEIEDATYNTLSEIEIVDGSSSVIFTANENDFIFYIAVWYQES